MSMECWILYVDGASRGVGAGIRLVLQSPIGECLEQVVRMGFCTLNNKAEYEVVLVDIGLALSVQASHLNIWSDSQLVVNQVQSDDELRYVRMMRYLDKVKLQLQKFNEWKMTQITREENARVDALVEVAISLAVTQIVTLPIYYQDNPSILKKGQVSQVYDAQGSWMGQIIKYLEVGELIEDEHQVE